MTVRGDPPATAWNRFGKSSLSRVAAKTLKAALPIVMLRLTNGGYITIADRAKCTVPVAEATPEAVAV